MYNFWSNSLDNIWDGVIFMKPERIIIRTTDKGTEIIPMKDFKLSDKDQKELNKMKREVEENFSGIKEGLEKSDFWELCMNDDDENFVAELKARWEQFWKEFLK